MCGFYKILLVVDTSLSWMCTYVQWIMNQYDNITVITWSREHADCVSKKQQLLVLPLYGGLPPREQVVMSFLHWSYISSHDPHNLLHQLKVFHRTPPNTRKIIVATNLAETSVTIAGIVYGKIFGLYWLVWTCSICSDWLWVCKVKDILC